MAYQVNMDRAYSMAVKALKAKKVPMLWGSPGIGKSALGAMIAEHFNLILIDLRLDQAEPTDLMGFPHIYEDRQRAGYLPMETFPIEGDKVPDGYTGWLILLDEFPPMDQSVQRAAYKLILDRMVGRFKLHQNVAIMAAGNMATDNAIVEEMSTALQSRVIHMQLQIDYEQWCSWAEKNGVDYRITSFIKFKPDLLYSFKPDHTDMTYAAPRTWMFTHDILQVTDIDDEDTMPLLAGTISEGVAREFVGFCKIYNDLPTIGQITANPDSLLVPTEPSILFAMTGMMANHADKDNISKLMTFIKRMPVEFQVVCLRETIRREPDLFKHQAVMDWRKENASELF